MNSYKLLPFNFKKLDDKYLLVNDTGSFDFLDKREFDDLINKKETGNKFINKFAHKNKKELNHFIEKYKDGKSYLDEGTILFIMVLTNRCNQNCIYCQASKKNSFDKKYDMSQLTAKEAVDLIMQSPQKYINIEFQGGEPLLNFEILKYIVLYIKKNEKKFDKKINFNIVSNLLTLNINHLKFFFENKVSICTSLDGDKMVHEYNRPLMGGNSYDVLIDKINLVKAEARRKKKRITINAIQTTTRESLKYYKEIVDTYVKLEIKCIYIRPLNRFGLADKAFNSIGYSPYEYLDFYRNVLRYIIDINKKGTLLIEGTAQIFLQKIFQTKKINHMEVRSPCGATIGQIAINYNGEIFTCDEGRMLAESGDKSFKIGNVHNSLYKELYSNNVTKTVCMASCMECSSRCYQCAYLPYCGICPIANYVESGDIFKNSSYRCIVNEGLLDIIFKYLKEGDRKTLSIFNHWSN